MNDGTLLDPGVRLRDVSVHYGAVQAVDGASFDVPRGGITALVGPSGSGKSSLLLAVNRLHALDDRVRVTGSIAVLGQDVRDLDDYTLRRRVGLIFQRPVPFPMSIRENLRFPLTAHGYPRAEIDGRIEAALRKAALWEEVRDRLLSPATTLSGGQQQRLCLARALVLEPILLLLDEPCAALDPQSSALVEETLRGLAGDTTLLMVTHNLGQARRLASTAVCLWPGPRGGRVLDEGPMERVCEAPRASVLTEYFAGRVG